RGSTAEFRRDRLIVSVRSGFPVGPTLDAVKAFLDTNVEFPTIHNPPGRPWAVIQFQPLADAEAKIPLLAAQLAQRPDLRYAEPDFLCSGHNIANDPMYLEGSQWWIQKIGIADMWEVTRGSSKVLLAIVDSGISIVGGETDHQDLRGARYIVRNTLVGIPVPHDYTVPLTSSTWPFMPVHPPRDGVPHGTHVAGIAAALTNNNIGVAGANWDSDVYIARVLDDNNNGSPSSMKFAVDDVLRFVNHSPFVFPWLFGSHYKRVVINLSLGSTVLADSLLEMCEETSGGKIIICASAESRGVGDELQYPAAYATQFPHVFAVGGTDQHDVINMPHLGDYSGVTIFAPGVGIRSTTPTYPCTDSYPLMYADMNGPSQACPIVSGSVSLLWSAHLSLTPSQIRSGLIASSVRCTNDLGTATYPRLNLKFRPKRWWQVLRPSLPWQ
ncbi:MAG TPA: S8 family serine peptidase, partial [Candidatus Krumholzibacteria bacterium]|nr:S8 family serine peptidase [Candidatus Krumholzibacteria bacterium]